MRQSKVRKKPLKENFAVRVFLCYLCKTERVAWLHFLAIEFLEISMKIASKTFRILFGAALAGAFSMNLSAGENPFAFSQLGAGTLQLAGTSNMSGQMKCGGKMMEGMSGEGKMKKGKCGTGKCGSSK